MKLENLLIIEDNEKHIQDARDALGSSFMIARDFREFEYMMNKHEGSIDGILSDLYFPRGDSQDFPIYEGHKIETLKILDEYIKKTTNKPDPESPIVKAVEQVIEIGFGNNYEETINNLQKMDPDMPEGFYNNIRKTLGINEETKNYQKLRENISQDNHLLPEGIFVYKEAQKRKIPCKIVTDSYHHGIDFQPFTSIVMSQYFDQLTDDKKQWQEAYDSISKQIK